MKRVAADSSVVVAALLAWHEWHRPAFRAIDQLLRDDLLVLPIPALLETYSVLTRLPSPHRVSPADAYRLIKESFQNASLVGFPTRKAWSFLRSAAENGIAGGVTYDAAILECARQAEARSILTFNRRDYERLARSDIDVTTPGE